MSSFGTAKQMFQNFPNWQSSVWQCNRVKKYREKHEIIQGNDMGYLVWTEDQNFAIEFD